MDKPNDDDIKRCQCKWARRTSEQASDCARTEEFQIQQNNQHMAFFLSRLKIAKLFTFSDRQNNLNAAKRLKLIYRLIIFKFTNFVVRRHWDVIFDALLQAHRHKKTEAIKRIK